MGGDMEKDPLLSSSSDISAEGQRQGVGAEEEQEKGCQQLRLVEPAFFLYMLAIWSFLPLNEEYVYDRLEEESPIIKAVLEENGDCQPNHTDTPISYAVEAYVKTTTSNYTLLFNICENLPAIFVSLIMCTWGDRHGRKIGLLLPCVGGVLKGILYIAADIYSWPVGFLVLPNLLEGMSGSHMTIAGCAYAYIADVVPASALTFRFSVLNALLFAGSSIGNVAIGYMIRDLGYLNSFAIMTAWYAMALLYIVFLLPETVDVKQRQKDQEDGSSKDICSILREVLGTTVAAFKVYTRSRPDKSARYRLILMLCTSTLHAILVLGQVELDTLFLIGPPFCFDSIEVGYFLAFLCATSVIGPIVGTKLFQMCKVPDAGMGLVASLSGAAAFFLQAFASTKSTIFLVPVVNFYSASITALSRAIMSKDVTQEEQGALQASVSSMNTLGDLVSVTLLIGMFSATVRTFYGATFVLIGSICLLCFICFLCVATCLKPMANVDDEAYAPLEADARSGSNNNADSVGLKPIH